MIITQEELQELTDNALKQARTNIQNKIQIQIEKSTDFEDIVDDIRDKFEKQYEEIVLKYIETKEFEEFCIDIFKKDFIEKVEITYYIDEDVMTDLLSKYLKSKLK